MELKLELLMLIVCVTPVLVKSITISSNGHSPKTKMLGGMMVDVQQGFVPMTPKPESTTEKSNYEKSRKLNSNTTKLALNERYRRLIPYMTFYYANNDLAISTTENTRNIEVEKAQILEAQEIANQREAKKIYSQQNIPRYQGNRLTQYNIASANPSKIFYKNGVPVYQIPNNFQTFNYNPLLQEYPEYINDAGIVQLTSPAPEIVVTTSRPYLNFYNEESPNIRYYLSEREQNPKYKLVPYEQTPPFDVNPFVQTPINFPFEQDPLSYEQPQPVKIPVKVAYDQNIPVKFYNQAPQKSYANSPVKVPYNKKKPQNENVYATRKPVLMSVLVPKELYVKPRPVRPPVIYDSAAAQPARKQPSIVTNNYYEKQRPQQKLVSKPVVEGGFKPIVNFVSYTTVPSIETSSFTVKETPNYVETSSVTPTPYYQYVVDQPKPQPTKQTPTTLASLLNSLQINKSIPKPITKENVGYSIKTLLQALNTMKASQTPHKVELSPLIAAPRPFVAPKLKEPPIVSHLRPETVHDEKHLHLAPIPTPSQHLDDERPIQHPISGGSSHRFPPPVTSDDEGGTPGRPGHDYPILTTIPQTSFECKAQRYKGFFADTETRCQVWHYCDLNGGQASFLCPNGTIFSQAGLTCDWWFNVRCNSTTQLYVLNESLYKYILPQAPKFPEDYSGPLVDKYLTLKFKEMEEEFRKNKNKQSEDKNDSDDEEEDSNQASTENSLTSSADMDKRQLGELNESSVIIESPGSSGKVERLQDD